MVERPYPSYRMGMALFDSLLAWLVSVVGVATGAAYIPQALRIWKRGSSDDVSILTYLLFLGGQIVYFVYGIRIRQWPLEMQPTSSPNQPHLPMKAAPTERLYHTDSYVRTCEARIVAVDGTAVALDRAIMYPGGGGQLADQGC